MTLRAVVPDDLSAVKALLEAIAADQGVDALSEEAQIGLFGGGPAAVLEEQGRLVGCAAWRDEHGVAVVELVVGSEAGADATGRLLDSALEHSKGRAVRLWAVDDSTKAAAPARGLRRTASLLEFRCALPIDRTEEPKGWEIRAFRPGEDLAALVGVQRAAFPNDPWTEEDATNRLARSWFHAGGVFLAWEGERAAGAGWAKMHPHAVGEIYLLAVRPEAQGRSLGRTLALTVLDHVHRAHGATTGLAYTDAANRRARRLYAGLGFETVRVRDRLEN